MPNPADIFHLDKASAQVLILKGTGTASTVSGCTVQYACCPPVHLNKPEVSFERLQTDVYVLWDVNADYDSIHAVLLVSRRLFGIDHKANRGVTGAVLTQLREIRAVLELRH